MFDIVIFHVGGRNGTLEFPNLPKFEKNLQIYLFEADKECIEDIKKYNKSASVLPYCILEKNKKIIFNITDDPHASSIYKINSKFNDYFADNIDYDYTFSKAFKVIKKIELKTFSLNYLHKKNSIPIPDFLSIDAQGSEYLILKGADNFLKNNLLGISVETNFIELYKNQATFDKVDQLLKLNDFILSDMKLKYFNFNKLPNKLRGKGLPFGCDALYLKDPKKIFKSKLTNKNKKNLLTKLSFISFAYGFNEVGFQCLEYSSKINFKVPKTYNDNLIHNFLNNCMVFLKDVENIRNDWREKDILEKEFNQKQLLTKSKYKSKILRKIINFINNPFRYSKNVFRNISDRYLKKYFNYFILPFKLTIKFKKKSKFQFFLEKHGFFLASRNIDHRND